MARYLVQPRDRIFVKIYGFLSFGKTIGKKISENLSSKYSQKILYHAKQSAADALKTSLIRAIQKIAKATRDLIGSSIADKITRASKSSLKNNSKTNEEETPREKYISSKLR